MRKLLTFIGAMALAFTVFAQGQDLGPDQLVRRSPRTYWRR